MPSADFIDSYRSSFTGRRDQTNTEKKTANTEAKEKLSTFLNNLREVFENVAKEAANKKEKTPELPKKLEEVKLEKIEPIDENIVEYTYKPGDTFGQIIKNLGLNTDAGLWGSSGDVAYYTQQLIDQGVLDSRGNIPIGAKIRLRKRGAPAVQAPQEQTQVNAGGTVTEAAYPPLRRVMPGTLRQV